MNYSKERLKELQALPLERKVGFTAARITEFHTRFNGKCYISYSGGKDSAVLLYIARALYPDIKGMYIDTGLEYPEIKDFVEKTENIDIRKPKMTFFQVIKKFGYPVISKEVASKIFSARKKPDGRVALRFDENSEYGKRYNGRFCLAKYFYLLSAPFLIGDKCCYKMKKDPAKKYEKETGLHPITGTMTEESILRKTNWLRHGCNSFDGKRPMSNPMSFWTEQDVLQYIKTKNIPICSVYGEIIQVKGKLKTTGCQRTGCIFCLFGITQDGTPNRIQRLYYTHPQIYDYCLNKLGLRLVMNFIGVPYEPVEEE